MHDEFSHSIFIYVLSVMRIYLIESLFGSVVIVIKLKN